MNEPYPKTILPHILPTYPASLSPTQVEFDALLINHYMHDYMGIIIIVSQVESRA